MRHFFLFIAATLLLSFSAFGDGLSSEYACYEQLISHAYGANYDMENGSILLPATKGNTRGFYMYTKSMAYFCAFPKPAESNAEMTYYYLKVQIPGTTDTQYMTYSDEKVHPENPGIGSGTEPADDLKGKYVTPKCGESLTDSSRQAFDDELKARVVTVESTYESHKKYESQRFGRSGTADAYKRALNVCKSVPGLRETVEAELNKFPADAGNGGNNQQPGAIR